jgi:hypothetical protein
MHPPRRSFIGGLALAVAMSGIASSAEVPAPPRPRPLSEAQFKKILDLMGQTGAVRQIGAQITASLGAGPEDTPLTCLMIRYDEDKRSHAFAKLQDEKGFLLSVRDEGGFSHIYFTDNRLKLIRAIDEDEDKGLAMAPNVVAQGGLDEELAYWAAKADANFP